MEEEFCGAGIRHWISNAASWVTGRCSTVNEERRVGNERTRETLEVKWRGGIKLASPRNHTHNRTNLNISGGSCNTIN